MAVQFVQVRHDKLERTSTVPETAVPHLQEQGWRVVEPEREEPSPQGEPRTVTRPATLGRPAEASEQQREEE